MSSDKLYDVTENALPYIQPFFERYCSLSQGILSRASLADGRVVVYLPEDVNAKLLRKFEYSGDPASFGTEVWAFSRISEHLGAHSDHLVLFRTGRRADDKVLLEKYKWRYATFQNEVYTVLLSTDSEESAILSARRHATSNVTLVFFTRLRSAQAWPNKNVITESEMDTLVENTSHVLVGAYDGEGFIMWERGE